MEKDKYIQELNDVFVQAKACEKWGATLRAGELIAKSKGWFVPKNQEVMSITDYPIEVIERWQKELVDILKENNISVPYYYLTLSSELRYLRKCSR
ncbi:MAG: hypothetical protein NT128_03515 [Proteobacteria bacterium]|nr:hypothetical protein [Pseudomonadota bacterium]